MFQDSQTNEVVSDGSTEVQEVSTKATNEKM